MHDISELTLPEEGTTTIVNATYVQERVLIPRQRIIWYLNGWERGPVLLVDRTSILLFDMERRHLHTITTNTPTPTYVMHQIFNVFTESEKIGVDIVFSPREAIHPVAAVVGERWLEVLMLARLHPPTHQRLLMMRD